MTRCESRDSQTRRSSGSLHPTDSRERTTRNSIPLHPNPNSQLTTGPEHGPPSPSLGTSRRGRVTHGPCAPETRRHVKRGYDHCAVARVDKSHSAIPVHAHPSAAHRREGDDRTHVAPRRCMQNAQIDCITEPIGAVTLAAQIMAVEDIGRGAVSAWEVGADQVDLLRERDRMAPVASATVPAQESAVFLCQSRRQRQRKKHDL